MKHLRYLRYVLRHKWFVFLAACRLGIPWLGLTHDLSKFRPSEWFPYVESFYGPKWPNRSDWVGRHGASWVIKAGEIGLIRFREDIRRAFDYAWLLHQHRNPHHWQFWLLVNDEDGTYPLEMPLSYRKEMLADWRGAGRAQGKPDTLAWYQKNECKMILGPETRSWIETQLGVQE